MSQHITEAKLGAFADAVTKAAHEHLGADGVISIAVGVNADTYYGAKMSAMRDMDMSANIMVGTLDYKLAYFGGFVTVIEVDAWGEFSEWTRKERTGQKLRRF